MKAIIKIVSHFVWYHQLSWRKPTPGGKLKDLKAGTTIYLSSFLFPVKKDSVVAGKGRFEFNLALMKATTTS